mmetsp:Transcript_32757/g.98952  ORF Transcript_32757/g.98952 Transcript_32757/m.98952 type:complete len:286 (-) Transcript_32757:794-1651(-)
MRQANVFVKRSYTKRCIATTSPESSTAMHGASGAPVSAASKCCVHSLLPMATVSVPRSASTVTIVGTGKAATRCDGITTRRGAVHPVSPSQVSPSGRSARMAGRELSLGGRMKPAACVGADDDPAARMTRPIQPLTPGAQPSCALTAALGVTHPMAMAPRCRGAVTAYLVTSAGAPVRPPPLEGASDERRLSPFPSTSLISPAQHCNDCNAAAVSPRTWHGRPGPIPSELPRLESCPSPRAVQSRSDRRGLCAAASQSSDGSGLLQSARSAEIASGHGRGRSYRA